MNASAFAQVLKNPGLLRNYTLSELQELALRYPYASTVYSMVALKAHLEGDSNYEHYLNQAAIRIPDRKKLYHLIHSDYDYAFAEALPLQGKPIDVEEDFEAVVTEPAKPEPVERVEEQPVLQEEAVVEAEFKAQEEIEEEQLAVQEELKGEEQQAPIEEVQAEQAREFDPEEELELDEQIESRRQEVAFEQEILMGEEGQKEEEHPVAEETQLDLPGADEVLEALSALKNFKAEQPVSNREDIVEEIRREVEPKEKPSVSKEKDAHSFSEWLTLLKGGQKEEEEVKEEPVQKEIQEEERLTIPLEPPPPLPVEEIELEELPVETEEEKDIDEIITAKQAKASLTQDDELVTETLAQIYVLQGKLGKAIKAYETLSLKFPDKRAYFAEQIAKLKNK